MLFKCGMMTSFRQVIKPTMKNNAMATVIARRSVSIGDSTAKLGVRVLLGAGTNVSLPVSRSLAVRTAALLCRAAVSIGLGLTSGRRCQTTMFTVSALSQTE